MAHFTLLITDTEREELFRLLQSRLPENRLDTVDLGYEDEDVLRQEEADLIRSLLNKLKSAPKRLVLSAAASV